MSDSKRNCVKKTVLHLTAILQLPLSPTCILKSDRQHSKSFPYMFGGNVEDEETRKI